MNRRFEFEIDPENPKKLKKKFVKGNVEFKIYKNVSLYSSLRKFFSKSGRTIEEPKNKILFPKIKKKDIPLLHEQEEFIGSEDEWANYF